MKLIFVRSFQTVLYNGQKHDVKFRQHGGIWQAMIVKDGIESTSWFTEPVCSQTTNVDEVFRYGSKVAVFSNEATFEFEIPDKLAGTDDSTEGGNSVRAPMPGLVRKLMVAIGDEVTQGDALIVIEAMKMEHTLVAPRDGTVKEVNVEENSQVEDGDLLIALENDDDE